jgi:ubiquinone/menaquinone biosynthesis C-methylase UbiE
MAPDTYIHGTEPSEQERLAALNRMTNAAFVRFLDVPAGARVLEVGSGLGLLAVEVASAADGVHVVGIEMSSDQIAAAATSPRVTYRKGDAHTIEFPDASFDIVYARYLLEHVSRPDVVLSEMRRVVRPGGRVAVCENDISLMRLDPPCPAFDRAWDLFLRYQATLGGDAVIGRRLYRLFRDAGLTQIELSVQPEVHWYGSPGFAAWVGNIIGNLESARRGIDEAVLNHAVAELNSLIEREDASSVFVWNRARGIR